MARTTKKLPDVLVVAEGKALACTFGGIVSAGEQLTAGHLDRDPKKGEIRLAELFAARVVVEPEGKPADAEPEGDGDAPPASPE